MKEYEAKALRDQWYVESNRRAQDYRNSPEGKRDAQQAEEHRRVMQCAIDELMQQFETLDYSNLDELIQFFVDLTEPSDCGGVSFDRQRIVRKFVQYGFVVDTNTGSSFDKDSRDNSGRYLIGQALHNLLMAGAVSPVYPRMAQEWRDKFGQASSTS